MGLALLGIPQGLGVPAAVGWAFMPTISKRLHDIPFIHPSRPVPNYSRDMDTFHRL